MKKRTLLISVIAVMFLFASMSHASAGEHGSGGKKGYSKGLDDKVSYMAGTILKNQDELGLTDKEVTAIKNLKIEAKKKIIMANAEIDTIAVDIKGMMWEGTFDHEAENMLVERKYELKKEKAKYIVTSIAKLKGMLTEDQRDKLSAVCRSSK